MRMLFSTGLMNQKGFLFWDRKGFLKVVNLIIFFLRFNWWNFFKFIRKKKKGNESQMCEKWITKVRFTFYHDHLSYVR